MAKRCSYCVCMHSVDQESNVSKDMFDFKVEDNLSVLQSMKSVSSPSSGRPKVERNLSSSSVSSVSSSSVGSFPKASSFSTSDEGSTLSRLASTPLSATVEEDQLGIFTSPPPIVEEPVPKRVVKVGPEARGKRETRKSGKKQKQRQITKRMTENRD